jgi:hypothetical protein
VFFKNVLAGAGGMAKAVEFLPSKCPKFKPQYHKKKKKKGLGQLFIYYY